MTVPVYVVSSHMLSQRNKLNMVADNVANSNTAGYKKLDMTFDEIVSRKQAKEVGSFVSLGQMHYDFTQGGMTRTDSQLDVAIQGKGFFAIDREGQTQYTRNGHFSLSPAGELVTDAGDLVLDNNGGAIAIPADSISISITKDGTISNQNGPIAQLGVFSMAEPNKLIRAGASGYIYEGADQPALAETSALIQGHVEDSNINSIEETVNLTEVNRAYQSSARLVQSIEDLEQRVVRDLSRLP